MVLMEDKTIIIRNLLHMSEVKSASKYVLLYSSVVTMYKLGIDIKYINKIDVVVPESIKIMVDGENNEIYIDSNRETFATIGVIGDRLFMQEDDEDEKLRKCKKLLN